MKKKVGLLVLSAVWAATAAGCSDGGGEERKPFGKEEQATLRVMYWDEKSFYDDYGTLFQNRYPNVEFEVIGLPSRTDPTIPVTKLYEAHIESNRPDVMMLSSGFGWMARKGMLTELDPLIEKDKFDLDDYHPAVVSMLRQEGDGKLYGLSPGFNSHGLFYNLDLFKRYGIEPPRDSMTWGEVFELAKRFPSDGAGDDRIYGFAIDGFSTPLNQFLFSMSGHNRKMLDADGIALRLDTESWKRTFEELVAFMRSGAVYQPTEEERALRVRPKEREKFLNGKAAMTYDLDYLIPRLTGSSFDWGVATAPADPLNRTQSGAYELGQVFVIPKQTRNERAAWEFVKYVNSDEFAQLKSKASPTVLFSRAEYIRPQGERDISALHRLEPTGDFGDEFASYDPQVKLQTVHIIENELLAAADNVKTLEEAIEAMHEQGNEVLARSKIVSVAP